MHLIWDLGFCIFYFGTKPKPKESVKYSLQNSATSHLHAIVAYCSCEVAKKEQCKLLKICMKEPYFTDYFDTEFLTLCRAARNKVLYAVSSLQSSYSEVLNRRTCSLRFFRIFFPFCLQIFSLFV